MRIASLIALFLVAACAPVAGPSPGSPPTTVRQVVDAEYADDCAKVGGHLALAGKAQALRCIIPYADAGKACTDGAQCLGKRCMGDFEDTSAPTPATGTCVATNNPFGCQTIVEAGVARTICVD